nr:hypothetical protein [Tanacetum cinerariifolium]
MSTLAEFMILSGVDNHPLILEKHLYDSWKSIMELFMQNREHGRMILELVKHGSLIKPTIEENCMLMTKKYEELSTTEKIQVDCDLKETNIILQGLPSNVYSLVTYHRVTKDLWERVQLLMQDLGVTEGLVTQTVIIHNAAYQVDDWMHMLLTVMTSQQPRLFLWPICLVTYQMLSPRVMVEMSDGMATRVREMEAYDGGGFRGGGGESSHWQYKFPLTVKVVPTARSLEKPLSGVCTAIEEMMKKLPVKDRWQLH